LRYGVVEGDVMASPDAAGSADASIALVDAFPLLGPLRFTGERLPLGEVRLLAPVMPSKIIGIGRNYADHAKEMGGEVPAEPLVFLKPSTSVIGPGDAIVLPAGTSEVHHEAELAVVIGALCRDVAVERASEVIFGYTIANDVTARDWQSSDGQWWRAKGADTFCPLGPWIDTDIDPSALQIRCTVSGQVRQEGSSADMVRGVPELIAHLSSAMTLVPGDVILTGTPAGVGPLVAGDEVQVSVSGLGVLTNRVIARR
jgi:2-keto-4-pentenoate hydratase/2-oxohepta-3-ene-1,7-dioic acid hydratase in catechol pathway